MPKLRTVSGSDLVSIFKGFGFFVAGQKGSHIKLKRESAQGFQTLTIPNHKEIDRGTLKVIYSQACRYVQEDDLRDCFYHD